ncbi:MAG: hypothetical protein ABI599_05660 [Flavobacteriales bacterium]
MNNTAEHPIINTPVATVQRTGTDLVEVRFTSGCVLNVTGIAGILDARAELNRGIPDLLLAVFPAEEVDFELTMISTDHYQGRPVEQHTRASAWVVRNEHNERFTRLYFAYFPSPVPSAIFMQEQEARAWLQTQR